MTAVQKHAAELSDVMAHDRDAMHQSPLHEVRDYRPYSAGRDTDEPRHSTAHESSRGRRRRR
jgi:hypothetical protein